MGSARIENQHQPCMRNDPAKENAHFSRAPIPTGKLPLPVLNRLLREYVGNGDNVYLGAGLGRDATVIELSDRLLIVKTDPITFVADDIGAYVVHVNANDVACMGGEPKWFLATILLPSNKTNEEELESIFQQISNACKALAISWCGGHTEITATVSQPVVVGCLLAEAPRERRYAPERIQSEDHIILTKGLAVEATTILSREKEQALAEAFELEFAQRCRNFLSHPGISVMPEARLVWDVPGIHALHDPTEGGLANAVHELLEENELGVEINESQLAIFPETKVLCEHFDLDPLGVIASGALLVVGEVGACEQVMAKFREANVKAAIIGRVLPKDEGRWLVSGSERHPLPLFRCDEIIKALAA